MVYIDVCQGRGPLILRLEVGARLQMPTTSTGRAYVAGLAQDDRELLYARLQAFHGDRWPRRHDGLGEDLRFHAEQRIFTFGGRWNSPVDARGVVMEKVG